MISNVLKLIQDEFQLNWSGEVHDGDYDYKAWGETWINISVEPINTESLSYSGCIAEEHMIYITAYHRNATQAALLADEVINFIKNRQLGELYTRSWHPVSKGMMGDGKAFYKFGIAADILN